MKVLVVNHYYAAHGGGIELVVRHLLLATRLVAPDILFTWAATRCDPVQDLPGVSYLPMRGTNAIERRLGVPQPLWSFEALVALARAVRKHDVVWLHDTLYMGNIVAFIFAKCQGKPVVITQHVGMVPFRRRWLRALMRHGNRFIAATMLRRADRAVFIAAQVQDYFTALAGSWRQEPELIPNGVQHTVYKQVNSDRRDILRQKFGLDMQPALLFVGRFVEKKGMGVLRRLAAALPDYDWVFAGKGIDDPALWNLKNCLTLRDRSGAGIAELYQAADLLLLPSSGEGLPLVIQEAAACGLPVMCAPETAQADAGLPALLLTAPVDPDDDAATAQAWEAAIKAALADRDALAARGHELRAFAQENWAWDKAAARYAALFRTLLPGAAHE